MHRSEKRTGEVVKTMHWKTMPATAKYLITHIRTVFVFLKNYAFECDACND